MCVYTDFLNKKSTNWREKNVLCFFFFTESCQWLYYPTKFSCFVFCSVSAYMLFLWDMFSIVIAGLGRGIKYFCLVIWRWIGFHSGCYNLWWIPSNFRWVFIQVFLLPVEDLSRWGLNDVGPWFCACLHDVRGSIYLCPCCAS